MSHAPAPAATRRLDRLDLIRLALLAVGLLCWATGVLPHRQALASMERVAPLLLFLGTVMAMVVIVQQSQVFDVAAMWLARLGRGRHLALFGCCVVLATATTVFLNLDTTIVLLTPVMLALARETRSSGLATAMTTVWLANTASLLLPVSNLTNLLAADRIGLSAWQFGGRMWAPQLVSVLATAACLWWFYWRPGTRDLPRYTVPGALPTIGDPALFGTATVVCLGFVVTVLAGVPIEYVATAGAAIMVGYCLWRRRDLLSWSLIPWRLLVFVVGLFLVVPTVVDLGVDGLLGALVGTGDGPAGVVRAGLTGGGLSNLVNNLPAYTATESVVPAGNLNQLFGLLIGTNVAPIMLPWASLATLLWFDLATGRRPGVPPTDHIRVGIGRYIGTSAVLAVVATTAALAALIAIG